MLDKNQSIYFVEFQGPGERQYFISNTGTTLAENEQASMPEELAAIYEKRKAYEDEQEQIKQEMRNEWRLREEQRQQLEAERKIRPPPRIPQHTKIKNLGMKNERRGNSNELGINRIRSNDQNNRII